MKMSDRGIESLTRKCVKCEGGKLTRVIKPLGNPNAKITMIVPQPDYSMASSGKLPYEWNHLLRIIEEVSGVDVEKTFRILPVVRCVVNKIKKAHAKGCEPLVSPFVNKRTIVFGKTAASWLLFDGLGPPDLWIAHGTVAVRDGKEYLILIGPELLETYREYPERLHDMLVKYRRGIVDNKSIIQKWGRLA